MLHSQHILVLKIELLLLRAFLILWEPCLLLVALLEEGLAQVHGSASKYKHFTELSVAEVRCPKLSLCTGTTLVLIIKQARIPSLNRIGGVY